MDLALPMNSTMALGDLEITLSGTSTLGPFFGLSLCLFCDLLPLGNDALFTFDIITSNALVIFSLFSVFSHSDNE